MRNYNMEKAERLTQFKAIFVTLMIHFGLLFGLMYINNDRPEDLVPDLVKEWISGDKTEEAVATSRKSMP